MTYKFRNYLYLKVYVLNTFICSPNNPTNPKLEEKFFEIESRPIILLPEAY